ncbi:transporter substrate-binding protein [Effusibacillus lacus]|uniref:Sigma-54-dependent Fis family transcriptional regulator n=1 Tax=Effusibacillus lacus TaxID=1348429 RepID=A0A292YGW8_9BACL|nr:transporter substrate-binding protein [Effusibacillus lacus]TCS67946.1 transcriptional regulator with PAS, ATPase and Fis domain [Effusibacillus lacus]GAX89907.1 sigma-54-dependent Fis family transcriptional regulator [Effusibacillus lacus]
MENQEDIKIGLLYSLTGTTGVTERGQYQSTLLAIKHINDQGGIHGRRLLPIVEDIASDPFLAAKKAEKLIVLDKVAVLIGLYTSVSRKMVIPILEKHNVLLFYPTLYEGEELCRNVFYCGPVPNQQLQFFIPWLITNFGKCFYLIGSDYIYPRQTNRHIDRLVQSHGGRIVGEHYSILGTQKFDKPIREIVQAQPDVVFSTLVGDSVIAFYQQYRQSGIPKPIASGITAETEIQAMNAAYAVGHYTSFPYFNSIRTDKNHIFQSEYRRTYGTDVISSVMENAYNGVFLIAEAMRKCEFISTDCLRQALSGITLEAPQGNIKVDEKNHHLWLHSRIGRVNEKGQFDIVWESDGPIAPIPFYSQTFIYEKECAIDNNVLSHNELQKLQNQYQILIEKIKSATRVFPYIFAIFDHQGVLLETFSGEKNDDTKNISLLNPGIRWTSPLMKRSGITLALSGHTEAIVFGEEHDIPELQEFLTIGIPIKGNMETLKGVVGVFLELNQIDQASIDLFIRSLSQTVECCVEIVDQVEKCALFQKISRDISQFIPESLLLLENGKILFTNSAADKLIEKHHDSVLDIVSDLSTRTMNEKEMLVRKKINDELYELQTIPSENYRYIFIKQLSSDNLTQTKSKQLLIRDIVGSNERFLRTIQLAKSASSIDANVLILGESGTGKEIFARAIHNESQRKNNPFIAINCGAMSRELINAELFGYVDGAFTGAKKGGNPGKFEAANGGTLFLDEIGDMPLELQATLLRVLQEREVIRVGGHKPIPIDVRIIAATNKKLNDEIAYKGSFRSDLYFRLNVFTIELVPLRERLDDIPELVSYFIKDLNETSGLPPKTMTTEALQMLLRYTWPGNVRELKNVVERAFYVAANSFAITVDQLPSHISSHTGRNLSHELISEETLHDLKKISSQIEKSELTELLVEYRGNISRAAKHLGISRTTLYRKLKEYQLIK